MENFESKPYKVYTAAHTRLNNYIKISIAALGFLFMSKDDNEELSVLVNNLIQQSGERWTPRIFKNPKAEITQVTNDLAKTGIIWVYSAFDVFFKKIEGLLSALNVKCEENAESNKTLANMSADEVEKESTKIVKIYNKLNWPLDNIINLLPIFKFYELLRHSVAHRSGYPSPQLITQSQSTEFIDAINNWETKFKGKNISPPPIVSNNQIELKGHHAILYSETCLRIAKDMNRRYGHLIKVDILIDKILKIHLLNVTDLAKPYGGDFCRFVACRLKNDYNVEIKNYQDVYEYYGNDEKTKKEHNTRYNELRKKATKK